MRSKFLDKDKKRDEEAMHSDDSSGYESSGSSDVSVPSNDICALSSNLVKSEMPTEITNVDDLSDSSKAPSLDPSIEMTLLSDNNASEESSCASDDENEKAIVLEPVGSKTYEKQ